LVPLVGYDKACMIAKKAAKEEMTLREAAVETGWVTAEQFDTYMDPAKLAGVK
jgi:fumarate hydratase class II